MLERVKIRYAALMVMLAVVIPLSIVMAIMEYRIYRREVTRHVDAKLELAATFARLSLPVDYHDQLVDAHSVSTEEFDAIVDRFNQLCEELDLEYLWSLMMVDGVPVFTSSTSPDKRVENQLQAKFFEPHSNPELYEHVFSTMEPQTKDNIDKWGEIRVVLIPYRDAHGRKYLFGASKRLSEIEALTPFVARNAITTLLIFFIPLTCIGALIAYWLTRPIAQLAEGAANIRDGDYESPLEVKGPFEVRLVADRLNAMRISIRDHIQSLNNLYEVIAQSPIYIYRVKMDESLTTEFISDNYACMGYDLEDLRSNRIKWKELVPPQQFQAIEEAFSEALANQCDGYAVETAMRWASGEVHWYKCWNQFLRDAQGTPISIQGIMTEITDIVEARERDDRYRAKLKGLARELAETEERERSQLATSLHDDLGQMLAALNMKFAALKEARERDRIEDLVQQVDDLMARVLGTCKSLTWEISPTSLYVSDIEAGLVRLAEDLKRFFDLDVAVETGGGRLELDVGTAALIFRIGKELLVNVSKHSGTTAAELSLTSYGDKVHMAVSDEGRGFDAELLEQGDVSGYGLFSIRERLERLGGSVRIESIPGKGAKILLIIPLDVAALS